MTEGNNTMLVLRDRRLLAARVSPLLFFFLLLAVILLPVLYAFDAMFPEASWLQLLARLAEFLARVEWSDIDWLRLLPKLAIVLATFGHIWYLHRAARHERLTLSAAGIGYTSPLPRMLKRLMPDWFLPWGEISRAELGLLGKNRLASPLSARLTLSAPAGRRCIAPALWVDPATYRRPRPRLRFTLLPETPARAEIIQAVMASDILRYLSANVPQLAVESTLDRAEAFTSLENNPHGRIATGIVFLLLAYALGDFVLVPESYIDQPATLLHIYIAAGIIAALAAGLWLRRSALSVAEKIGLPLLIGALAGVAMLPGALRINALTAPDGDRTYDYLATQGMSGIVLRPVAEGLPTIDYFLRHRYWGKFDQGKPYAVRVRKGILGFYQFNSDDILADIHEAEEAER